MSVIRGATASLVTVNGRVLDGPAGLITRTVRLPVGAVAAIINWARTCVSALWMFEIVMPVDGLNSMAFVPERLLPVMSRTIMLPGSALGGDMESISGDVPLIT